MSDLAKLLNQLSVESGAAAPEDDSDHSYIGAEEITVVTDETQTELEESIADTAEKVEKMQEHDVAAEKVAEAVDSLESNLAQLRAMAAAGQPLDHSGLRFYIQNLALSVEARDLPVRLVQEEVEALQYSFESNQIADYTTEAEEKTGNVLTRLWAVLVAAFKSARTAISQFFGSIGRSADALVTGGQQLQRLGAATKGEAKKTEIKASSYGSLTSGGSLTPGANIDKIISLYRGEFATKIMAPVQKAFAPIAAAMKGPSTAGAPATNGAKEALAAHGLGDATLELPGGAKAELKIGDKISFTISKPGAGPEKAAPLSPSEVAALGGKLVSLGRWIKTAEGNAAKYVDEAEKVLSAAGKQGTKITDKVKGDSEEKTNRASISAAVTTATRVLRAGEQLVPTYVGYAARLGKDAYNFGKASLGAYGGKAAEPKPAAGAADGAGDNQGN